MVWMQGRQWSKTLVVLGVSLLTACSGQRLSQKLEPLGDFLQRQVDEQKIAGAVVLVRRTDSNDTYVKAVGKKDLAKGTPLPEDALFRIASMTKPITSVAAMMLVEQGAIGLDDPIAKYLPEWESPRVLGEPDPASAGGYKTKPAQTPITVRHLLTHTSGISYRFMGDALAPLYAQAGSTDGFEHTSWTLAEESRALAALPLKHEPGTAFSYGLNADVLGYLIEKVSGRPLDQLFEERIFKPLGMKDTRFFLSQEQASRLPPLYRRTSAGALEQVPATGTNVVEGFFAYAPDFQYAGSKTFLSGGAGLVSTAADYARFLQMLANGGEYEGVRLLKKETIDLMTRNQVGTLRANFFQVPFGLGFGVQEDPARETELGSVGTYFWAGVFKTAFWVDPQKKLLGVVMCQLWDPPSTAPDDIRARIYATLKP